MTQIYISLGSNVERERYVDLGLTALAETFGEIKVSSLYACEAVGFEGPEFYNLVVAAQTDMTLLQLTKTLRCIELANGRAPDAVKFSPRTLDLDLLLFDDIIVDTPTQLPRAEILHSAFVLCPLAEIAGELTHPIEQVSYKHLWQAFDQTSQKITQLPLTWRSN